MIYSTRIVSSRFAWHALDTFGWREPPPIGCGYPYDLESEIHPPRRGKKPLLTNFSTLLKFGQFCLLLCLKILRIDPYGELCEKDFPESAGIEPPKELEQSRGGFFLSSNRIFFEENIPLQ
jgi:hypothetical protein